MPTRIIILGLEGVLDPINRPVFRGFIVWLREGTPKGSLSPLGREVFL